MSKAKTHDPSLTMTSAEVAKLTGFSPLHIYNLGRRNKIKRVGTQAKRGKQRGGKPMITYDAQSVRDYMASKSYRKTDTNGDKTNSTVDKTSAIDPSSIMIGTAEHAKLSNGNGSNASVNALCAFMFNFLSFGLQMLGILGDQIQLSREAESNAEGQG